MLGKFTSSVFSLEKDFTDHTLVHLLTQMFFSLCIERSLMMKLEQFPLEH